MSDQDFVRIIIGDHPIGIMGLKTLLENMGGSYREKTDAEIGAFMIERLGKKNYIPSVAIDLYVKALAREYRKSVGQPFEEEPKTGLNVKVLGPGCSQCDKLEVVVMEVMNELNLPGSVEHVRDVREIARFGIMGVPALVINGKVFAVGSVPPKNRIRTWLQEARA